MIAVDGDGPASPLRICAIERSHPRPRSSISGELLAGVEAEALEEVAELGQDLLEN